VAFVGNLYPGSPLYEDRRRTLNALAKRYKCNFQTGVYFQDMANVYASACVAFNKSVMGDLNMRVFEAMCSGRPLVTDLVKGINDLFGPCAPVTYDDRDDLFASIDDLLDDPGWANICGQECRRLVLKWDTYTDRAEQMLREAGLCV